MGGLTGVSPGSNIRSRKTRQLSIKEIDAAKKTVLAGMLPGSQSGESVRNLHKSKIWQRRNVL